MFFVYLFVVLKLWASFGEMQVEEIPRLFSMDALLRGISLSPGVLYSMYKDHIRPRLFNVSENEATYKKDKKPPGNYYEKWIFNM